MFDPLGELKQRAQETLFEVMGATLSARNLSQTALQREINSLLDEIIAAMNQVAEGVKTTRVVMDLGAKHDLDLPIAREVYGVLYEGRTPAQAYRGLVRRSPGAEHEPD